MREIKEQTREMQEVSQIMTRRFHFEEWMLSSRYSQFEKESNNFLFVVEVIQEDDKVIFTASLEHKDQTGLCIEYTFILPIDKLDKLRKHWITFRHRFLNLATQGDRFARNTPFTNE